MHSRRSLIGTGAAGIAALTLSPLRVLAAEIAGPTMARPKPFADMVGSSFHLAALEGAAQGSVSLAVVEELSTQIGVDQFNLHFVGSRWASLPEGLYAASNWRGHPHFEIHLQPVGQDGDGSALYIACFAVLH